VPAINALVGTSSSDYSATRSNQWALVRFASDPGLHAGAGTQSNGSVVMSLDCVAALAGEIACRLQDANSPARCRSPLATELGENGSASIPVRPLDLGEPCNLRRARKRASTAPPQPGANQSTSANSDLYFCPTETKWRRPNMFHGHCTCPRYQRADLDPIAASTHLIAERTDIAPSRKLAFLGHQADRLVNFASSTTTNLRIAGWLGCSYRGSRSYGVWT